MPLFVKIERGVVDKKFFDRHVPAHKEYVRGLIERGHKARSGHWATWGGGMLIFEAADLAQARVIAAEDPLVKNGCVVYDLHEWKVVVE